MSLPAGASSELRLVPGPPPEVIKRFRSARARAQEEAALRRWGPALTSLVAPALRGVPDELTVRIEWLPGRRLGELPRWRERLDLARRIGQGLAELHALPADPDPMPLEQAVARRMDGWLERDDGALGASARHRLTAAFDSAALRGLTRVPCHRDVSEANVLVHGEQLALVDWEHARADCAYTDLLRFWTGLPLDEDPWVAAVAEGAGLADGRGNALRALGLVEAAGCVVWGAQRGDDALIARGRSLIDRLC